MGLQAGVMGVLRFGLHCPHVPPQRDNQHPRRNQKKQERRDGPQGAEDEGIIEIEFCNLQIEFCIIHEERSCEPKAWSTKKIPQTDESADGRENHGAQEHLGDLPGDPACQAEQDGVRETDNLGAVEKAETGGEPQTSLVCDHPEHDDDLVAEAQWVLHALEVYKLKGIQEQQPMQEKPGEAETQKDKITVAQWLPPHHVPNIHQENEGIGQNPHCKLQGWKQ